MSQRKKRFEVKAWIGVCDGDLSFGPLDGDCSGPTIPVLATHLFKTRRGAQAFYEDVRRVTLVIHRGLEGPKHG